MLFKHLTTYGKFFSPDGEGGGGAGAGAAGHTESGGTPPGNGAGEGEGADGGGAPPKADPEPSANKLLKDFAKQRGVTVAELLDQFTELENAGKTELQRLEGERDRYKTEVETLRAGVRASNGRSAVIDAATKANAIDAQAVFAIVQSRIDYDDKTHEPTNVDAVLAEAKKNHPALFRASQGSADGGKGGSAPSGKPSLNDLIRAGLQAG